MASKRKPSRKSKAILSDDPFIQALTPDEARDGLATRTVTPLQLHAAMNHQWALGEAESSDEKMKPNSHFWMAGQLAIIAAPYFHAEVSPIVTYTYRRR